ncbi:dienelactone hydrolase family protein [Tsuneonella amylolytica]|uniref:dienelactone hydrolase family protein n=1 Tax=Tsuneonella amylolytica TaxID=2338327 RepID=UPI000EA8C265|nr:dienelactone hydrolase family protein [Tsuneonella amylolytica]
MSRTGFEEVAYRDGDTALVGLLARPTCTPRAAVAVFPTIFNTTPGVEAKALALADAGYAALICDFYGRAPTDMAEAFAMGGAMRGDAAAFRRRLRAGLGALRQHTPGLPMLAIGFCMGGQAVLELARDGADLLAVASFHGLLDTEARADRPIVPRILVCHGDADTLVPREQVIGFWEEMDAVGADWHFHSYAGVAHGFTNPCMLDGTENPAYDASADRQSWSAMHALFDEVLSRP